MNTILHLCKIISQRKAIKLQCLVLLQGGVALSVTSVSVRDGSFFAKSKITLQKWLILLYWWVREYPVSDAAEEAEVTRATSVQAYQYFRDVCTAKLLQAPILLGGPGIIVQIDESLYRHKPKVSLMRLYM